MTPQIFAQMVLFIGGAYVLLIAHIENTQLTFWVRAICYLMCLPGALNLVTTAVLG